MITQDVSDLTFEEFIMLASQASEFNRDVVKELNFMHGIVIDEDTPISYTVSAIVNNTVNRMVSDRTTGDDYYCINGEEGNTAICYMVHPFPSVSTILSRVNFDFTKEGGYPDSVAKYVNNNKFTIGNTYFVSISNVPVKIDVVDEFTGKGIKETIFNNVGFLLTGITNLDTSERFVTVSVYTHDGKTVNSFSAMCPDEVYDISTLDIIESHFEKLYDVHAKEGKVLPIVAYNTDDVLKWMNYSLQATVVSFSNLTNSGYVGKSGQFQNKANYQIAEIFSSLSRYFIHFKDIMDKHPEHFYNSTENPLQNIISVPATSIDGTLYSLSAIFTRTPRLLKDAEESIPELKGKLDSVLSITLATDKNVFCNYTAIGLGFCCGFTVNLYLDKDYKVIGYLHSFISVDGEGNPQCAIMSNTDTAMTNNRPLIQHLAKVVAETIDGKVPEWDAEHFYKAIDDEAVTKADDVLYSYMLFCTSIGYIMAEMNMQAMEEYLPEEITEGNLGEVKPADLEKYRDLVMAQGTDKLQ